MCIILLICTDWVSLTFSDSLSIEAKQKTFHEHVTVSYKAEHKQGTIYSPHPDKHRVFAGELILINCFGFICCMLHSRTELYLGYFNIYHLQTNNKPTKKLKIIFVFYGECFATSDHNTVFVFKKGNLKDFRRGYLGNREPVVQFKYEVAQKPKRAIFPSLIWGGGGGGGV